MQGYDNHYVIDCVKQYLPQGASILELGMGIGLDFQVLNQSYQVLGTDYSPLFIEDYKKNYPDANIRVMDARLIDIDQSFDCVFSNKVLQHLTKKELLLSLKQQKKILNGNGIIFMTLWYGDYWEEWMMDHSLLFTYYTEQDIIDMLSGLFHIESLSRYTEMEENDSLMVVLRNFSFE